MKIAITDACIFIDLYELGLTVPFFSLDIEVHTSIDVINELYESQQQMLKAFQSVEKLTVHIISEADKIEILSSSYPKSLSDSDKTVLYLAVKLNAMIISSDKTIRNSAKNNSINYHGMIWIFDQLVKQNLITKSAASTKLKQLITTNLVFQNNKELVEEMGKRLAEWSK
jgi:predicted nucleic acid-binding protein